MHGEPQKSMAPRMAVHSAVFIKCIVLESLLVGFVVAGTVVGRVEFSFRISWKDS